MRAREDRGTVRLRIARPAPCVVRLRWWSGGALVGEKRVHDATAALRLPAGRWSLEAVDDRVAEDPARLAAGAVEVDVRAGWRTDAEVALARGAVLVGNVRTGDGGWARWAAVEATYADGRVLRSRADGRGAFVLGGVGRGPLLLRATKGAHQSTPQLLDPPPGRHPRLLLPLTEPLLGESRPGDAEPRVGAAFRGTVVDPLSDQPAYAAVVELRDARGALLARTRTDHAGEFVVGGTLPPSSGLTLVVKSGPDRAVVDRVELRGLACGEARLVDVGRVDLLWGARAPRPARASLPRATAAALRLPATRV